MRKKIICIILAVSMMLSACKKEEEKTYDTVSWKDAEYVTNEYILIEKQDLSKMNDQDSDKISKIGGIERVELYGTANRISYYCNSGEDYEEGEEDTLELMDISRTMRSVENLTEEDILKGKLPEEMNEIALYSSDKGILGKKLKIYLYDMEYMGQSDDQKQLASKYWNQTNISIFEYGGYCLKKEFTVTGLLKEKTTQVYFSDSYCSMISRAYAGNVYLNSAITRFNGTEEQGLQELPGELSLTGNTRLGINSNYLSRIYSELDWNKEAKNRLYFSDSYTPGFFVYQEGCEDNEIRISERLVKNNFNANIGKNQSLYPILLLSYFLPKETVYEGEEWVEDELGVLGLTNVHTENGISCNIVMEVSKETHSSGAYVVGIGKKLFDRIYGTDGSYEMAVFPEKGTDREELEKKLVEAGYKIYEKKSIFEIYDKIYNTWELSGLINGEDITVNERNYRDYLD